MTVATVQVVLGWTLLAFSVLFFALKVSAARSYAAGNGGGAPVLDGAIFPSLFGVVGAALLASLRGWRVPFVGFWVVAFVVLLVGTALALGFASRVRR